MFVQLHLATIARWVWCVWGVLGRCQVHVQWATKPVLERGDASPVPSSCLHKHTQRHTETGAVQAPSFAFLPQFAVSLVLQLHQFSDNPSLKGCTVHPDVPTQWGIDRRRRAGIRYLQILGSAGGRVSVYASSLYLPLYPATVPTPGPLLPWYLPG